jgi:hypothetical protein
MGRSYPIKKGGRVKGFRSRGSHPKSSDPRRVVRVDRLSDSVASFASAKGWRSEPTQTSPTAGFEVKKPSLTTLEKWRRFSEVSPPEPGLWMNKGHSMVLITDPQVRSAHDPVNDAVKFLRIGNEERVPPTTIRLDEKRYPNVRVEDSVYQSRLVKEAVSVLAYPGASLRFITRASGNEVGAITNDLGETILIAQTLSEEPSIRLSEVK